MIDDVIHITDCQIYQDVKQTKDTGKNGYNDKEQSLGGDDSYTLFKFLK